MNPLTTVSTEIEELQCGIDSLGAPLQGIEQGLMTNRDYSFSMVSDIMQALNGVMAGLPERRQALHKIEYEIDQAKLKARNLQSRGAKVGQGNLLSRQKERLSELRHIYQDLKSDLECIESFQANFQGRLTRLKG